jgi:2,4-dienoyl-CoA reductase (NADPH2)
LQTWKNNRFYPIKHKGFEMDLLFKEGQIGSMTVPNRIVMAAMHLGYADQDGYVTDRLIRYYEECAKGEVGLIVVGGFKIHKLGGGGFGFLSIANDSYMPKMKELNDRLKAHGSKTTAQIFHSGRYAFSFMMEGEQSVSASEVPSKLTRETPRALSVGEIGDIVGYFRDAALRVKKVGFDSVEIIGSTGYLISQFLSPISNLREDDYGGSLENRARFGMEVIRAIKDACGADYPVIMRHSGAELMDGGNSLEDSVAIAKLFEQAGADAISIQVGWHESKVPTVAASVPRGAFAFLGRMMRREVSVPIMSCNRINDPHLAEQILGGGGADFVAVARALNADPYFAKKARQGRADEIIPCTGCNEGCLDMIFTGRLSTCMNNPIRGNEAEMEIVAADKPKKVLVVGGGPGGLEAARVLCERGHDVTLYEKGDRLGGRLLLSSIPHGREEFENTVRYLAGAAARAGVKIEAEMEMTPPAARAEKAAVIVLATGSTPRVPDIPGLADWIATSHLDEGDLRVVMAEDALTGKVALGQKVVIIGAGGAACETGIYAARKGCLSPEIAIFLVENGVLGSEQAFDMARSAQRDVTLVRRGAKIGDSLGRSARWVVLQELRNLGVRTITEAQYVAVDYKGLIISVEGKKQHLEADTIIVAAGYEIDPDLADKWKDSAPQVHVIGDARSPRKGIDAILEGSKVGRLI